MLQGVEEDEVLPRELRVRTFEMSLDGLDARQVFRAVKSYCATRHLEECDEEEVWEIKRNLLIDSLVNFKGFIVIVIEETGWGIKVLKKEGIFQRFTYMSEYNIWAHKICHIYRCAATMRKTEHLEKNHRAVIMNKKKALEKVVDTGLSLIHI